jgi:hypothetical protein
MRNDGARLLASVNFFVRSSSQIRHKSDSIQLALRLQRDRKENDAESFHCDRIARRNARVARCEEKMAARKRPHEYKGAEHKGAEKSRNENRRAKTAAPDEDAAGTTTRRSWIRAP